VRSSNVWCYLAVVFFIAFGSAQAQIRERAAISYQGLSSDSGETGLAEGWLSERWFLDAEGNRLLQAGLQLRRTELPGELRGLPDDVWMIVPQANYLHTIDENYSLIANLRFGVFSDMERIGGRDLRAEGAVVVDRVIRDNLTLGLGVGRVSNFGRLMHIPLVHIIWSINEFWLLDAMLPGKLDLSYLASSTWEFALSFNITGARYSIESEERKIDGLGVGQMNLGPQVRYQVAPQVYVTAESGLAFARRLSLLDENTVIRKLEPNNEVYLRLGLQYRF